MISDWELWAVAHAVIKQHAERAGDHAADRIAALLDTDDEAGAATWRAIARRISELHVGPEAARRPIH